MSTPELREPDPKDLRPPQRLVHTHAEPLAQEIGDLLARMLEDTHTYVIIEVDKPFRFVQFLTEDGDWIRAETVGNRYLSPADALSDAEQRQLLRFGWEDVGTDRGNCGNYWRNLDRDQVDFAAQLAAITLCAVHGLHAGSNATVFTGRTATWDPAGHG
jgi:hypothetical protein